MKYEDNLLSHLEYEFFFVYTLHTYVERYVRSEIKKYSNGIIDDGKISFHVFIDEKEKTNGERGFLVINPLNNYTKNMLLSNKIGIIRYHKLNRIIKKIN